MTALMVPLATPSLGPELPTESMTGGRECERSRCGRECGGRKESKVDKQENEDGWDWRLEEIREREFSARYRGKRKVLQQGTFSDVMPE